MQTMFLHRCRDVLVLAAAVLLGLSATVGAQAEDERHFLSGIAIDGYDPVAYFTEGKAVEGEDGFTHQWAGATWHFANAANRDAFAADPQKYAPQYGGYCAWAVSQGYTAESDPEAWKIVDDRLFLNYNKSIQAQWAEDTAGNIKKGDANWPKIHEELATK